MNREKDRSSSISIHLKISLVMILCALVAAAFAWFSISNETLYSPIGIIPTADEGPKLYYGVSLYITIAATLLTSAAIRLAIRLTK